MALSEGLRLSDKKHDDFISSSEIRRRVSELGTGLAETYAGQKITLLTVLNGAMPFARDLHEAAIRASQGLTIVSDTIQASSYRGTSSTGSVELARKPDLENIQDQKVVLVEDIWDTGRTLAALCSWLRVHDPQSIEVYTFLDKPDAKRADAPSDDISIVTGMEIADEFVVGYGLDLNGKYRDLPFITVCDQITAELWVPRYRQEPVDA